MIHHRHANRKPPSRFPFPADHLPLREPPQLRDQSTGPAKVAKAHSLPNDPVLRSPPHADLDAAQHRMRESQASEARTRAAGRQAQKGKVRGSQNPCATTHVDQDAHQPRRREAVPRHCFRMSPRTSGPQAACPPSRRGHRKASGALGPAAPALSAFARLSERSPKSLRASPRWPVPCRANTARRQRICGVARSSPARHPQAGGRVPSAPCSH